MHQYGFKQYGARDNGQPNHIETYPVPPSQTRLRTLAKVLQRMSFFVNYCVLSVLINIQSYI